MYHNPNPFCLRCKINFFKNLFRSHILALKSVIFVRTITEESSLLTDKRSSVYTLAIQKDSQPTQLNKRSTVYLWNILRKPGFV